MPKKPTRIALMVIHGKETAISEFHYSIARLDCTGIELMQIPPTYGEQWAKARNEMVRKALDAHAEKPFDFFLFLDDDMAFPPHTLQALVNADKDIISGLYFARFPPHWPQIYDEVKEGPLKDKFWPRLYYPTNEVVEADAVGAGCLMVKPFVYESMTDPWFEFHEDCGEDMWFARAARAKGFKLYVNTGVICDHFGIQVINEGAYLALRDGLHRVPPPGHLSIAFVPAPSPKPWNGLSLYQEALGGSETAVAYMAKELAKRHHAVTVFSDGAPGIYDDVHYHTRNALRKITTGGYDVVVVSRWSEILDWDIKAPLKIFWSHDMIPYGEALHAMTKADIVFALSEFHAGYFPMVENGASLVITPNGVETKLFEGKEKRDFNRLVWTSNPNRGLAIAGEIFQGFRQEWPELELHVYGRSSVYGWPQSEETPYLPRDMTNIFMHEPLPKQELARELMKAGIWFYPNIYRETFAISAMEAQCAGLPCLTNPLGALPETVKGGILTYNFQDAMRLLREPQVWLKHSTTGRHWAIAHDWSDIAEKWEELLYNRLEQGK